MHNCIHSTHPHEHSLICLIFTQAPEQFEGRPVSEKVDQFAFGVMMWEMLTGDLPWAELDHPMQVCVCVTVCV